MLTCRRLVLAFLAFSAVAAQAQPAVPPLRTTAPAPNSAAAKPAAKTVAPAPVARTTPAAPAPVLDPDAPPTSDGSSVAAAAPVAARPATAVNAADAPPTSDAAPVRAAAPAIAAASADAPPTSDAAPTSAPANAVASATAPTAAAGTTAAPAVPLTPTVPRNYPITPEGNARFLADYAARPDAKALDGGVHYRVLQAAADAKAVGPIARGDTVTVSYRGWLIDGTAFDQTKPGIPIQFTLNGVVPGWRTALMKMKVGDLWEVVVPADQAYGAEGRAGRIPPNQTLIFVISLAKVEYAG